MTKDGIEKLDKVKPFNRFIVKTFEAFTDDTLLVASSDSAWRVDPATGRSMQIATGAEAGRIFSLYQVPGAEYTPRWLWVSISPGVGEAGGSGAATAVA